MLTMFLIYKQIESWVAEIERLDLYSFDDSQYLNQSLRSEPECI